MTASTVYQLANNNKLLALFIVLVNILLLRGRELVVGHSSPQQVDVASGRDNRAVEKWGFEVVP